MPLFDFRCGCGRTFEALMSFAALRASNTPQCPGCGRPTRRLPTAGAGLTGTATVPAGPDAAPASWNGTRQGDREYVAHWRRTLDARARLEAKHPELGTTRSPVVAHEGHYEGAPLTLSELTRRSDPGRTDQAATGTRTAPTDPAGAPSDASRSGPPP